MEVYGSDPETCLSDLSLKSTYLRYKMKYSTLFHLRFEKENVQTEVICCMTPCHLY